MPLVYHARCTTNNADYVGVTSKTLDHRRKGHISSASGGRDKSMPFVNAIRKYGEGAFDWNVLGRFDTFAAALDAEIWWIARLKPRYNVTRGGQGVVGITRSQTWKDQQSQRMKERGISDETRAKMRAAAPARIKKTLKPVTCVNDGKTFKSRKAAAEFYGFNSTRVTASLQGRESAHGLVFITGDVSLSEEDSARLLIERKDKVFQKRSKSLAARDPKIYLARGGVKAVEPIAAVIPEAPPPTYVEGPEEIWRAIPGYGGAYEASDHGHIRSVNRHVPCWSNGGTMWRRGKAMTGRPIGDGRMMVTLQRDCKREDVQISVLVALTFLDTAVAGRIVVRRDDDVKNDRASNLFWGTRKDASAKFVRNGTGRTCHLTDEQIRFVREQRGLMTQIALGAMLGVSRTVICYIQRGRSCQTRGL